MHCGQYLWGPRNFALLHICIRARIKCIEIVTRTTKLKTNENKNKNQKKKQQNLCVQQLHIRRSILPFAIVLLFFLDVDFFCGCRFFFVCFVFLLNSQTNIIVWIFVLLSFVSLYGQFLGYGRP